MKTTAIFFISSFFACISVIGQSKWDVGILVSPSISQIDEEYYTKFYDPIVPVNVGVRVNYLYHKFYFSTGFLHLVQGKKWSGMVSTTPFPEGGMSYLTQKVKIKGVFIPVNANYVLLNRKRLFLYAGVGVYSGYIYSQKFYPIYIDPVPVKIVDTLYFGANIGLGVRYKLSHRFSIIFNPNFLYQLRKEIPHEDVPAFTPRLWLMSFDIGIYYKFGKGKEENKES